jgi:hypothetical protein
MSEETNEPSACVQAKMADGMSREDAEAACQAESAEKAIKNLDSENFAKTIEDAVAIALKGWKEEIIAESLKAVRQVRAQLREDTIAAVKKTISPAEPKYVTEENLAEAIRRIQLQSGEAKTSMVSNRFEVSGDYVDQPGTYNDLTKKVNTDLDKYENEQGKFYGPAPFAKRKK